MGVSINSGSGPGGKKPVDAELNLVPFIDLLVCCICFLLITAVWTQTAQLPASLSKRGSSGQETPQVAPTQPLTVLVGAEGYVVTTRSGMRQVLPRVGAHYDGRRLQRLLRSWKSQHEQKAVQLTLAVEDGVAFRHLARAMELANDAHYKVRISDANLSF